MSRQLRSLEAAEGTTSMSKYRMCERVKATPCPHYSGFTCSSESGGSTCLSLWLLCSWYFGLIGHSKLALECECVWMPCVGVLQACEYNLCSNTSCHNDEVTKMPAMVVVNLTTPLFDAAGDLTSVPKTATSSALIWF